MTYDAQEKSRYGGKPVECIRFAWGSNVLNQTLSDRTWTITPGTFTPAPIERDEIEQSNEEGAGNLVLRVPRTHDVAALFIPGLPTTPVHVTLYRFHRGDAEVVTPFTGLVGGISFEGEKAVLTCTPIGRTLKRPIPILTFQNPCNWALYSTRCGVSKVAFRDTVIVTSVSGHDVVSNTFAARADGWYTGGYLEDATGAVRFVVNHVGDTVTLMNPFPALASGASVFAFAGCDRSETTCTNKFSNLVNHFGFARVPSRNPYDGSLT